MSYKFKYKKSFFWHTIKAVGHNYLPEQDKMVIYSEDGSLREIAQWSKHEVALGTDWVAMTKKRMEEKTGTSIPINIGG